MNKIVLFGRLTKDVEVRYTEQQVAVGSLTLAVKRNIKNKDGEYESDFINCVCFKEMAERISKYVKKGDQLLVEGRIQTRTYEDKDKNKRYATEVIIEHVDFIGSKKEQEETTETPKSDPYTEMGKKVEISDDDLPF